MVIFEYPLVLTSTQASLKRGFDLCLALIALSVSWWLILISATLASLDTRSNGFFMQERVGQHGRRFRVVKIKTMRPDAKFTTTVTRAGDSRITTLGGCFRRTKLDELPQLWNVLRGDMSFVGPRPDVPGFADQLTGQDRSVLSLRPGITGPATLAYRDEEEILAAQADAERYNKEVIYPDKVRLNLEYIRNWSLAGDVRYIWQTVFGK